MSLEANTSVIIYGLGISSAVLIIVFLYYIRRQNVMTTGDRSKVKQMRELESELEKERKDKQKAIEQRDKLSKALSNEIRGIVGETNFVQKAVNQKLEKEGRTFHQLGKKPDEEKSLYELSVESIIPMRADIAQVQEPDKTVGSAGKTTNDATLVGETSKKGITFYQKSNIVIREFDRSDFHFSSLALISGYFGEYRNIVYNPVLTARPKLFDKQELFLRIQTYLNNMVKDELYIISDEDLKELKKTIWSGDIKKIIGSIDRINEKNGFTKESGGVDLSGRSIFKYLLIRTLDNKGYRAYTPQDEEAKKVREAKAVGVMKKIAMKREGTQIELTPDETTIEEQMKSNVEIINEIASIVRSRPVEPLYREFQDPEYIMKEISRRSAAIKDATSFLRSIGWEFLDIDVGERILKIKVPTEAIFSRKIARLMEYYRREKDLGLIEFYLY